MSSIRCDNRPRGMARGRRASAALSAVLAVTLAACGSPDEPDVQVVPPATAAVSPELAAEPAGEVIPLSQHVHATAFDAETDALVLLAGDELVYSSPADSSAAAVNRVTLPGRGADLTLDGSGQAIVAVGRSLATVDLSSGHVTLTELEEATADITAVEVQSDGTVAVGTANGRVISGDHTVTGLVSTDVLVAAGDNLAAIDRRQSMIIEVFPEREGLGYALRAGNGASNAETDGESRVFVANTRDGELLVYTLDRLVLRQRYPVPESPFGIAYDAGRDLVWVTQTGLNEVAAYSLDTGIPVEVARYATVQQPDSLAVDSERGYLYVSSGTGGGVQRIPLATPDE